MDPDTDEDRTTFLRDFNTHRNMVPDGDQATHHSGSGVGGVDWTTELDTPEDQATFHQATRELCQGQDNRSKERQQHLAVQDTDQSRAGTVPNNDEDVSQTLHPALSRNFLTTATVSAVEAEKRQSQSIIMYHLTLYACCAHAWNRLSLE